VYVCVWMSVCVWMLITVEHIVIAAQRLVILHAHSHKATNKLP